MSTDLLNTVGAIGAWLRGWVPAVVVGLFVWWLSRKYPTPVPGFVVVWMDKQTRQGEELISEMQAINTNLRAIREGQGLRHASPPEYDVTVTPRRRGPRAQGGA